MDMYHLLLKKLFFYYFFNIVRLSLSKAFTCKVTGLGGKTIWKFTYKWFLATNNV